MSRRTHSSTPLASLGIPLLLLALSACTDEGLVSTETATQGLPTSTDPTYDPSVGGSGGTTGGTGGTGGTSSDSTTDTGTTTGEPMPPECDDAFKRCPHEFTFPDNGESSVDVMGDYAADGWTNGRSMTSDGVQWSVTVEIPWDTQVQYKYRIDGGDQWIPDPNNPTTVDDGFGGVNSVVAPTTCEWWSCDAGNIGTFDWRDSVIYFVFVDRFYNGDQTNDDPIGVEFIADWQGGDWAGITKKIGEGYFEDLGINTLWLSVPLDNTNESGLGVGGDPNLYSAYHGYWPQNFEQTEEHFGTMDELKELIDAAHARDIKVIVDYAMNHVHDSSPVYIQNPEWFWANDNGQGGNCICGEGCDWDNDAKRCWFTGYLPDFNFTNQAARNFSVDNAIWWIKETGVDGYRLDAVKHIEDSWMLDLRSRVKSEIETVTMEHFYMVGETYTGDRDLIKYYVNPGMLDGQFDFPLRMKVAENLLMRQGTMNDLEAYMNGNDGFYGTGIMSTFIGNHDIPRVVHLAEDTPLWDSPWAGGKELAWANQPGLPQGMSAFQRLATGFTLLLTTPGAPLIYYGDEIGLPGAGDPDNRRFMQWENYSQGQTYLFDQVSRLLEIRAEHPATRRGTRKTLSVDADTMAFEMSGSGDSVIVLLNRSDSERSVGGIPGGSYVDALGGGSFDGPSVSVPARGSRVLVK